MGNYYKMPFSSNDMAIYKKIPYSLAYWHTLDYPESLSPRKTALHFESLNDERVPEKFKDNRTMWRVSLKINF